MAIGLILAGQIKEFKVIDILTGKLSFIPSSYLMIVFHLNLNNIPFPNFFIAVYYGIENSFRSLSPHVVQVS